MEHLKETEFKINRKNVSHFEIGNKTFLIHFKDGATLEIYSDDMQINLYEDGEE